METGALLHAPSAPELAGWRVRKTFVGLALLVAAGLGTYIGIMGMSTDDSAGDGAVFVTLVTIGASLVIGYFGLRYLMMGLQGKGVSFFERAVEADIHRGLGILPRRRTVPLLHIRVSGSDSLISAQAITTTGHAFRLPPTMVEQTDPSFLLSLGTRPLTAAGRDQMDLGEGGEVVPYTYPTSDPLPDHGPAWPDPGTLPITVDVPVEQEVKVVSELPEPPRPEPPRAEPSVRPPPPRETRPPARPAVPAGPAPATAVATRKPPPPEPEMEVVMDLPDVVPPPDTSRVRLPPPPRIRPTAVSIPEPPDHRPMGRDRPPVPPPEPEVPPMPQPGPGPVPEPVTDPVPEAEPPPASSDEGELEEMPPPVEEKKEKKPSPGGEWEEM
ncbi:MAG: hypothetical protein KAJ35_09535 [Thermoplasmata archaeon]|nr:hypothetical protein [Thermoplasmata archaeon]